MIDTFIRVSLHLLTQIRYWHWQTDSYPIHQALGAFYDGLDSAVDDIAETAMRDDGRVDIKIDSITPNGFENIKDVAQIRESIHVYIEFIESVSEKVEDRSELVNMLDEVKTLSSKTLYLLTLE